MLTYEGLYNENMILYRTIAKQDKKLEKIKEILKDVNFLAPTLQEGKFWINADYVFRGDRLTLVNEYIIADNEERVNNSSSEMDKVAYESANMERITRDKQDMQNYKMAAL